MSAPPSSRVHSPAMPTMVSRLPKFGSRPKCAPASSSIQTVLTDTRNTSSVGGAAATTTRLTNGFYHHPGPAGLRGRVPLPPSSVKPNGFIRAPIEWRRENRMLAEAGADAGREWTRGQNENRSGNHQYYSQRLKESSLVSQCKTKQKTVTPAGKGRGFVQPVTSSSSQSLQSSLKTQPVSKAGSQGSKPRQTASRLINGNKRGLSGPPGSRPHSGTNGSLRQPRIFPDTGGSRPGSGTGSPSGSPFQKKPTASRSHSSDSLGTAPTVQLTESDRVRSRSLTQVRRQPSPFLARPSTSVNPSHRITRAAEPTASSAQAPPGCSLAKSPVTGQTPQEGGGRGGGVKASGRSGARVCSLLPPSALKKPLLPNVSPTSKPSGISYKLSRPSLIKQARPLRVTPGSMSSCDPEVTPELNSLPSNAANSTESTAEAPHTEGLSTEPVSQAEVSIVGETLEDMSLSSSSSLDRNDTSQEYMDDFDNLGNGGVGIMLLSSKTDEDEDDSGLDQSCARFDDDQGVAKATGLCFLEEAMDWASIKLSGDDVEHHQIQLPHRRQSSQPDYHDQGGSSLDLSPSDSCGSGGTYMWDEEGLEPLGGAIPTASIHTNGSTAHHIGSFDSDVNSIDILNDLDSCDLEDDDLMLDADFAEDTSLHSDGDGMSHMAQWRRRQLCWGTQDVHNDSESRSLSLGSPPGLGLDVEELAEDCSAVRSQLEHLQMLLLQEEDLDEDTLTTDTLSPESSDSSCSSDTSQVQALLQEVQQLREELRSRDRTIAQLTLQLTLPTVTARCCCNETTGRMDQHTQTSVTERESVASQTPWKDHAAVPPVPFLSPPWQYQRSRPYRGRPRPAIPSHLARKITDTSLLQPEKPGTTE